MTRFALIAVCVLCLAGCGDRGKAATHEDEKITNAAANTTAGHVELADFSVDLPPLWRVFDLSAKDFESAISRFEKSGQGAENLAGAIRSAMSNKAIKMFAFDFSKGQIDFVDNLNVIVLPSAPGETAEKNKEGSIKLLSQTPSFVKPISFNVIKIGSYDCAYGKNQMIGQQAKALMVETYAIVKGGKTYTFSFTCDKKRADAFFKQARAAMLTVKLK